MSKIITKYNSRCGSYVLKKSGFVTQHEQCGGDTFAVLVNRDSGRKFYICESCYRKELAKSPDSIKSHMHVVTVEQIEARRKVLEQDPEDLQDRMDEYDPDLYGLICNNDIDSPNGMTDQEFAALFFEGRVSIKITLNDELTQTTYPL